MVAFSFFDVLLVYHFEKLESVKIGHVNVAQYEIEIFFFQIQQGVYPLCPSGPCMPFGAPGSHCSR